MLDINDFRAASGGDPEKIRASEKKRGRDETIVDKVIELDEAWRQTRFKLDMLNGDVKTFSKEVGKLMKEKKAEEAAEVKAKVKEVKQAIEECKKKLEELEAERDRVLKTVGNLVHESVPVHDDEEHNEVVETWGEMRAKTPDMKEHHDLLYMIDGYEPEKGSKVAGNRGYFLKGPGLMISLACLNMGTSFLIKRGYTPMQVPYFMKKETMGKVAQLSQFDEELYGATEGPDQAEADKKYLIATSEQPLAAYHQNDWIDKAEFPLRYAGYSTCFRKEAGSGRDARGIFRVHQFDKVEQFCLTAPENSWEEHDRMVKIAAEYMQELGISYRLVNIVSGALNDAAAKKIDLEGWFPAQGEKGTFRELVSVSNCTDYQARRLMIRYGASKVAKQATYVHMLNGTLCANTRTVCVLLETYQTEDGIQLPKPFWSYLPEYVEGKPGFIPFVREALVLDAGGHAKKRGKKK